MNLDDFRSFGRIHLFDDHSPNLLSSQIPTSKMVYFRSMGVRHLFLKAEHSRDPYRQVLITTVLGIDIQHGHHIVSRCDRTHRKDGNL